jgi:hypothetical protein
MGVYQIKKSLHIEKKQSLKSGDNSQNGRKLFTSYSTDKGLISRIYKELNPLKSKRTVI